jgi:hypothetical protein
VSWRPFEFGTAKLSSLDGFVSENSGLVHSTRPQRATGYDSHSYFVKGPEQEIVFAELAGCVLANAVELPVPSARVCSFAGDLLAGTRKVSQLRAAIDLFISKPHLVTNYPTLYEAVVVDAWLGNNDRNMGNVIGCPARGSSIEFVFIDFERAAALRPHPSINSGNLLPRDLWPSNDLGHIMNTRKPLMPPQHMLNRVRAMDEATCLMLLTKVSEAMGGVVWLEDSAFALASRAAKIDQLARDVWK